MIGFREDNVSSLVKCKKCNFVYQKEDWEIDKHLTMYFKNLANQFILFGKKVNKMNILVIGGAGFLGSHVADFLTNLGHNVTIFDNTNLILKMIIKKLSKEIYVTLMQ